MTVNLYLFLSDITKYMIGYEADQLFCCPQPKLVWPETVTVFQDSSVWLNALTQLNFTQTFVPVTKVKVSCNDAFIVGYNVTIAIDFGARLTDDSSFFASAEVFGCNASRGKFCNFMSRISISLIEYHLFQR